jgi:uncharacterized protein YukE
MASEMPARVEAVAGAVVVDFPWESATAAVAALDRAAATLDSQLAARPGMVGTLDDWVGTYRDEFDDALGRITSTASGLKETLATLASSIVAGGENANQAQREYNHRAELAAHPVGAGGPAVPV